MRTVARGLLVAVGLFGPLAGGSVGTGCSKSGGSSATGGTGGGASGRGGAGGGAAGTTAGAAGTTSGGASGIGGAAGSSGGAGGIGGAAGSSGGAGGSGGGGAGGISGARGGAGGASNGGAGGSGGAVGRGGGSGGAGGVGNAAGGAGGVAGNFGGVDAGGGFDAACATESASATPVPLDLYLLVDTSKSMLTLTTLGPSKWDAARSALAMFFSDSSSAGLGVGLKYFPNEQANVPATCTVDGQCTVGGTSYGPCDRRRTCVGNFSSTIAITPLCFDAATDCGSATTQTCALIQDCGNMNACAAGPSAPATSCTGCTPMPGYCHGRDVCTSATYAIPDVAISALPGATGALTGSLNGHSPDGNTPTGPALQGALDFARSRSTTNPGHRIAVALVTDGLPGGGFLPGYPPTACAPNDTAGIAALATAASAGTPPIPTFVIGIVSPGLDAQTGLDTLAKAGGTTAAFVTDTSQDVTQKVLAALQQIETKARACAYRIPTPTRGTIDFDKVNVQVTSGSGSVTTLGRTSSKAACVQGGWYYDVNLATGTPTEIISCDVTCAQLQADAAAHVDVVFGCTTISAS